MCKVQEVVHSPLSFTLVPLAPKFLKGLFNLRGLVIPVLDMRELMNLKGSAETEFSKIAIVEIEGACIGLLFDKTGEVFKDNHDERNDFDTAESESVIQGVFKKDAGRRLVQILDVTRLFKLKSVPKDSSQTRLGRKNQNARRGQRK